MQYVQKNNIFFNIDVYASNNSMQIDDLSSALFLKQKMYFDEIDSFIEKIMKYFFADVKDQTNFWVKI